ncbi:MAG: hypothetical protein LQ343_002680 [Gyalolechia ehrenbergii]|nr:MAG: hypothetical protein LQ343_002680 [Gyalolechia ehrenbergii]
MPPSKFPGESSGGKRKDPSSDESITTPQLSSSQRSLPESFKSSASQEALISTGWGPSSKRAKLDHSSKSHPPSTIATNKMYDFSKPNHIDLTNGNAPAMMTTVQQKPVGMATSSDTGVDTGPKKLVVKNLRKTPRSDPEKYFNDVWAKLDSALSAILSNEKVSYSNEELYRGSENLCRQGRAAPLFKTLCEKCKQGISNQFQKPLVSQALELDDIGILRANIEAWDAWNVRLKTIRSIFFFLDRSYLLHSPSLPSIQEMGTNEFRTQVFSHPALKSRILSGACQLVAADRETKLTEEDSDLLRKGIKMFHSLGVYTSDFEPELLGRSSSYFASWSDQKAETLDLAHYVGESQSLIDRELQRSDTLGLDSTTRKSLETYLEDLLIDQDDRQKLLLSTTGIADMLKADATEALKQLYDLLQRRGLCEKLRPPFEAYIADQGSQIVFDEAREQEMVVRLLNFKKKLDIVWEHSFSLHEGLGHTLREAFEAFINKSKRSNMTWGTDNPKPGEMIAKHVDMILKGGLKAISATTVAGKPEIKEEADASSEDEDVEINRQLDQVLELFRFVHGKAVFEAFYKRDLARRLLLNRSASADAEKSMLTRLKSECGAGFTHNLEQMFKDMELAREEVTSYKSQLEERGSRPSVDLNVSVLSASAWPSYPDVPLIIPREVQQQAAVFEQHYKVKHSGRKLTWKHSLAHCQLKANLPKGNKELVVSSYQAVVLLIFKDRSANDEIPYEHIQAATGLDDVELKRTLQSLACAKYRVLSKTPKGKNIDDNDTFSINANFSDPKYRIKINQIQAKETKEENKETHERVAADRNYETQAAIVRIMKARRMITHVELVAEVITATKSRGVLDPTDIKKNIEKLIEKDYMEREETEDGRNAYQYLA